ERELRGIGRTDRSRPDVVVADERFGLSIRRDARLAVARAVALVAVIAAAEQRLRNVAAPAACIRGGAAATAAAPAASAGAASRIVVTRARRQHQRASPGCAVNRHVDRDVAVDERDRLERERDAAI